MTTDEPIPDGPDEEIPPDEPLIDDTKPISRHLRVVLIALAVGMFVGGIAWNIQRGKSLREQWKKKNDDPSKSPYAGPRYVAPPPGDAYPWVTSYDAANSIAARIPPPSGTVRVEVSPDGFAHWLRYLPVKPGQQKVMLHDGQPKRNQHAHWAVLDVDVGPEDLQQSAKAVLRLRAEYLFARNKYDEISFHISRNDTLPWNRWRKGDRPVALEGGVIMWNTKAAKPDDSYANFRKYLDAVFGCGYADAATLALDMKPVSEAKDIQIGDVFVHPGKPGHAVIVVDMVRDAQSGDKGFLLAQSFIPAQDVHILVNAYNPEGPPWYRTNFGQTLRTPEWTFPASELRRFP
ncbi:MAG: DUF4846 domain-containing protein [Phycisphaerae bacterium]|nr:DUF4846 domain-containing protein [Phycisphaerae bacterium]